jgi:hypothetical protein
VPHPPFSRTSAITKNFQAIGSTNLPLPAAPALFFAVLVTAALWLNELFGPWLLFCDRVDSDTNLFARIAVTDLTTGDIVVSDRLLFLKGLAAGSGASLGVVWGWRFDQVPGLVDSCRFSLYHLFHRDKYASTFFATVSHQSSWLPLNPTFGRTGL